jgi:ribonucleotide monophosphatase NagD (HAD superfamily)
MPDTIEIETTALTISDRVKAMVITDSARYTNAANLLKDIAAMKKQIREHHRPTIEAAYEAHKLAVAAEKRFLDPLTEADKTIRDAMGRWNQLQAVEKAEREEDARKADDERRLAEAIKVEEGGAAPETVNLVLDTPKPAPAPLTPVTPTVEGVHERTTWHAEVTDLRELCKAVAEGNVSIEAVNPNMTFLNDRARMYKAGLSIPGVKAICETGLSVRG